MRGGIEPVGSCAIGSAASILTGDPCASVRSPLPSQRWLESQCRLDRSRPVPAAAATSAAALPIRTFSHLLIDPVHHHLFITSGAFSSSILVTDYSGQTVATIQDEPSATGLALSSDGSTVYAALPDGDAISAISTSTLAETARYATGTGTEPTYVADTKGKIWFGYGGSGEGEIGSVDPRTSPATVTLKAVPRFWYAAPMLAATEGGELVGGEPGRARSRWPATTSPAGAATVLAQGRSLDQASDLGSMQLTPDGKDVVIASGDPAYRGSTGSPTCRLTGPIPPPPPRRPSPSPPTVRSRPGPAAKFCPAAARPTRSSCSRPAAAPR